MTLMVSQMGMAAVGAWGEYASASIEAGMNEKIQAYRNTMSKLSAARSTNAVTVNEVRTRTAGMETQSLIQRRAMQDQAQAEVEAAAAGVSGNSVEMVINDLRGSAGRASYAQKRQVRQQLGEFREQKTSIQLSAIANKDIQVIPKPSIGSLLLGMGTDLISIYDSHQPPGERLLGPNE